MNGIINPNLNISNCPKIYKMYIACKEGDEKNIPILSHMNWERLITDYIIVEPGNKERGIRKMMNFLHAPCKDVVVFGNDVNDITMFQPIWTNIAMGDAVPELKEKADFVTYDSKNDGIAYALKHYGWID